MDIVLLLMVAASSSVLYLIHVYTLWLQNIVISAGLFLRVMYRLMPTEYKFDYFMFMLSIHGWIKTVQVYIGLRFLTVGTNYHWVLQYFSLPNWLLKQKALTLDRSEKSRNQSHLSFLLKNTIRNKCLILLFGMLAPG